MIDVSYVSIHVHWISKQASLLPNFTKTDHFVNWHMLDYLEELVRKL